MQGSLQGAVSNGHRERFDFELSFFFFFWPCHAAFRILVPWAFGGEDAESQPLDCLVIHLKDDQVRK